MKGKPDGQRIRPTPPLLTRTRPRGEIAISVCNSYSGSPASRNSALTLGSIFTSTGLGDLPHSESGVILKPA
jgi:hypothetical protein